LISGKVLVGAIGLEPTTPTMSISQLAMRSFRINILRYAAPCRNDCGRQKVPRLASKVYPIGSAPSSRIQAGALSRRGAFCTR